jgi:anti-anti-sigma regulatory factor
LLEALGGGRRRLVLDLHEVSKIEPEALALLWGAMRGIRRRGGRLAVAGPRPAVAPALRALSSGGLMLHGTVRAALSDAHDPAPRT